MLIRRILHYGQKHGFTATVNRILLSLKRTLSGSRFVLFYCDLDCCKPVAFVGIESARVQRKNGENELDSLDLRQIIEVWNPKIRHQQVVERFAQGAALWLYKLDGKVAAYGWSLVGGTVEPHFFPLGLNDVHLFDFFVFPEYRGKRLNVFLVNHILAELSLAGRRRAFIEAAEWNVAQLASLSRTPFRKLGYARKFDLFGRLLVIWSGNVGLVTLKHEERKPQKCIIH